MAVKQIGKNESYGPSDFIGSSQDIKLTNCYAGSTFYEWNTGIKYIYDGFGSWHVKTDKELVLASVAGGGSVNSLTDNAIDFDSDVFNGKTIIVNADGVDYYRKITSVSGSTINFNLLKDPVAASVTIGSGLDGEGQIVIDCKEAGVKSYSVALVASTGKSVAMQAMLIENVLVINSATDIDGIAIDILAGDIGSLIAGTPELDAIFEVKPQFTAGILPLTVEPLLFTGGDDEIPATAASITIGSGADTEGQITINCKEAGVSSYSIALIAGTGESAEIGASLIENVLTITSPTDATGLPVDIAAGNIQGLIAGIPELDAIFEVETEFLPGTLPLTEEPKPFTGGNDGTLATAASITIGSGLDGEGQLIINCKEAGVSSYSIALIAGIGESATMDKSLIGDTLIIISATDIDGSPINITTSDMQDLITNAPGLGSIFEVDTESLQGILPLTAEPLLFTGGHNGIAVTSGTAYKII